MDEAELHSLYQWVDGISLTRPKRNIARDFSDGVLMAEMCKHFFPKYVDLHNYSSAQSVAQKQYNWHTLDRKVFKRLNFYISKKDIEEVTTCVPGSVEKVLCAFKLKVQQLQAKKLSEDANRDAAHTSTDGSPRSQVADEAMKTAAAAPSARAPRGTTTAPPSHRDYTGEIIQEKDETIQEMRETIDILEIKIKKMEQLLEIKDHKINTLLDKLQQQQAQVGIHQPHQQVLTHETPMQEQGVAWSNLTAPFQYPPGVHY
eukprot:TRINITY_DN103164_c0_g1_i1.p2 TRINITY_DN103164_c0_g1~~TRINITY_DN103164_c0_g1_i1.p2  ORF type:complete len:279 (-),score=48.07 TRINITY_DN103164_c0_g1_i1:1539-2315(-)